ncbi:MAG: inner membrane-spanning protein YciB [Qingshengfaniella sp.]
MNNVTREIIRQVLELGPVIAFVAGYVWLRDSTVTVAGGDYDGFVVVTAVFIPLCVLTNIALWRLTGKVSRVQIFTLVLVVIFGGLTVWLNDERFFKMKGTISFGIMSGLLWIGIAMGKSWLEYMLDGALPITHRGWMILTRRLAIFLALIAAGNEVIWRSFSTDIFVAWDTFGQMALMAGFFVSQAGLIRRHTLPGPDV